MGTLLILLGIGLLIAAIVVFVKGLEQAQQPRRPGAWQEPPTSTTTPTFDPVDVGPGTTVNYRGIDYVVRGTVTLRQQLDSPATYQDWTDQELWFGWQEHLLGGGDEPIWFSVKQDEGRVELVMWTRRDDLDLRPYGKHVVDGHTFRELARDRASYTTEGTTGLSAAGDVEFVEYINSDKAMLLSIKRWAQNMPREVWHGRVVLPDELTVGSKPTTPA